MRNSRRSFIARGAGLALGSGIPFVGARASKYPEKTVRIIFP